MYGVRCEESKSGTSVTSIPSENHLRTSNLYNLQNLLPLKIPKIWP